MKAPNADQDGQPTVLVTQAHLVRFAGSEMVTLEIVEALNRLGARVTVVSHLVGEALRAPLEAAGATVFASDAPELSAHLEAQKPDFAWIHHGLVPEALLVAPGETRFVFNHMSGAHWSEFDLTSGIEERFAALSTFNSPETLARHREAELVAVTPERARLFRNPAPAPFFEVERRANATDGPLLVVSNHPPHEIVDAVDRLESEGRTVLRFGDRTPGFSPQRMSAEILSGAGAVITIGKTVQYALAAGVPVYVYDKFGGPGWLDSQNFELTSEMNFSGRGFTRRSGDDIYGELMRDGADVDDEALDLKNSFDRAEYDLDSVLRGLLLDAKLRPPATPLPRPLIEAQIRRLELERQRVVAADAVIRFTLGHRDALDEKQALIEGLRDSVEKYRLAAIDRAAALEEKNELIAALRDTIEKRSAVLDQRDELIAALRNTVEKRSAALEQRDELVATLRATVAELESALKRPTAATPN